MKNYYLKNIFTNITRQLKESAAITALVFFVVTFLSMTVFFSFSNQLENTLLQHVPMNYVASESGSALIQIQATKEAVDYYLETADKLDEFGKNSGNPYTLVQQIAAPAYLMDEPVEVVRYQDPFYGYSEEYVTRNSHGLFVLDEKSAENIRMTQGRLITENDYGRNYMVVPDCIQLYDKESAVTDTVTLYHRYGESVMQVHEKTRNIQVGDKMTVEIMFQGTGGITEVEFEVIGLYDSGQYGHMLYTDRLSFSQMISSLDGLFLNDLGVYFSGTADNLELYIEEYRELIKTVSEINADGVRRKLIKDTTEVSSLTDGVSYINYKYLEVQRPEFASLLASVYRVKGFYRTVFTVSFAITLVMFAGLMIFILNRKKKEMSVYYSLGRSKTKLIGQYCLMYSLIALVGIAVGITAGYFLTQILINRIAMQDVLIQQKLLKYAGGDYSQFTDIVPAVMTSGQIIRSVLIAAVSGLAVINLTTAAVMMMILKGNNLRDKLAGG